MKYTLCFILFIISSVLQLCARNENDSLLKALDKIISDRLVYTERKKATIEELKLKKTEQNTLNNLYHLNIEIIHQYETFVCDSAERYIHENIGIAEQMGNQEYILESKLQLAFVYCLSGLFVQANDILKLIQCDNLSVDLKSLYCWNRIRYYENIIKYTDDARFSEEYVQLKEAYRDTVMGILDPQSDEYLKEKAVKLQYDGKLDEALQILYKIYDKQKPETHEYAMMAMGLARLYKLAEKKKRKKNS